MRQRRRTTQAIEVRARQLRREQTPPEARLWERLLDRRLDGFKFRRQQPLGKFIADFYCPERRLIVEIDGEVHRDQSDRGQARTAALDAAGYILIRWSNEQIDQQLPQVLDELRRILRSSPSPAAAGEGAGG